jgi:molybdopterin biosynthesis enzyme
VAGDLIDIATARERVLAAVEPLSTEDVPLREALGRVLAADVSAEEDCRRSTPRPWTATR